MTTKEGRKLCGKSCYVILDVETLDPTPENEVCILWWDPDQPTTQLIQRAKLLGHDPKSRMVVHSGGYTAGAALDLILEMDEQGTIEHDDAAKALQVLMLVCADPRFTQAAYGGREASEAGETRAEVRGIMDTYSRDHGKEKE